MIEKVIETTVADRIRQILEKTGEFLNMQIKAQNNRSTVFTLKLLTEQIKTV